MSTEKKSGHSAEAAALGFWYQSLYALLTLIAQNTDDAAIGIEKLDDVELCFNGQKLLYQLKHSIIAVPPPISVKSRSLWRTIKVWIDALPLLVLAETTFHLVTVGGIVDGDPLVALTGEDNDRTELASAMMCEAERVLRAREEAAKAKKTLPYSDRYDACQAFIDLNDVSRLNLLRASRIHPESPTASEIELKIISHLQLLPVDQRPTVARRLVEWWDRQVLYSLCGERERIITRSELQAYISLTISEVEQGKLVPDFLTAHPPEDYQPNGMLAKQVALVKGARSDLAKAIREQWRAREQRASWTNYNPAMKSKITDYDKVLSEHWSDMHMKMIEDCTDLEENERCASGLVLLRWTHDEAPTKVPPLEYGLNAPYYIRGSYQTLAINLMVGWHPDYKVLLKDEK